DDYDLAAARTLLSEQLPAPLIPRLVVDTELPTRTSGKVDRNALPWPLAGADTGAEHGLTGTAAWVAQIWVDVLAAEITGADADFFELGGGSLSAAQLVSALRTRYPQVTVADIYDHPPLGPRAELLDDSGPAAEADIRRVEPTPRSAQLVQILATVALTTLTGLQWVTWLAVGAGIAGWFEVLPWLPRLSWWWTALLFAVFITPL